MRILGNELAGERLLQDGLAECISMSEVSADLYVQHFGGLKPGVENPDDFGLFVGGADWNRQSFHLGNTKRMKSRGGTRLTRDSRPPNRRHHEVSQSATS